MTKELIKAEELTPANFTDKGMQETIEGVARQVSIFTPNVETSQGREEIRSLAYQITLSKGALDRYGKTLTDEWKAKSKAVDKARKTGREALDKLAKDTRLPLTEWEAKEEERKAKEKLDAEITACWDEAHDKNKLFDLEKAEQERIRREEEKAEQERQEKIKLENEQRIAAEAKAQAEKEAKEAIERAEREKREVAIAAKLEAERKEQERLAEEQRQKDELARVEREKKEALERAEREKQEAIEEQQRLAALKAERIEQERLAKEETERQEAERQRKAEEARKADLEHRRAINAEALSSILEIDAINEDQARTLIIAIAKGWVKNISINY